MPSQQDSIAQNDVAENVAVVPDVTVRHQKVAVADASYTVFFVGTAVHRHPFAKNVVVTDFHARWAALVAEILGFAANDRTGKKAIPFADRRVSHDDDIALQETSVTQGHVGTYDTEGTDLDVAAQLSLGIDLSEWRNARSHEIRIQVEL